VPSGFATAPHGAKRIAEILEIPAFYSI
jgi:hypothetical protein